MYSRKQKILIVIVFILSFFLSLGYFIYLEDVKRATRYKDVKTSFELILDLTGSTISNGYCQWDDFFQAVMDKNSLYLDEITEEITADFPYIRSAEVIDTSFIFSGLKPFFVHSVGETIYIDFKIYNDLMTKSSPLNYLRVGLDGEQILADIQEVQHFSFLPNSFKYSSIRGKSVFFTMPFIQWYQILVSLFLCSIVTVLFERSIYSRVLFFYESRGLEKIISIFEHAERYSANHSKNVATIAYDIGIRLGLKRKELKDLKIAALLHDIGKISIPKDILNKNGPLTEAEYEIVKKHTLSSAEIVENFEELSHLSFYIKYHHEKMDGSGYPSGLKGEAIPFFSRIIAVADVFEALIGVRPYREPADPVSAIHLMETEMSLDTQVLAILKENLEEIYRKLELIRYEDLVLSREILPV